MNKILFEELVNKYFSMTVKELSKIVKDPKTPAIELAVVKLIHETVKKGDEKKFAFLLDRLIGKPKEKIEVEGSPYEHLMKLIIDRNKDNENSDFE